MRVTIRLSKTTECAIPGGPWGELGALVVTPCHRRCSHRCRSSIAKSCPTLCDPWTAACQALCPLLSPGVCSDSYPLSWWCYLTISSSAALFYCIQSFPASGSFPMSHLFASSGQSIRASASLVLPMIIQGWFPLGLTGSNRCLSISKPYPGLSKFYKLRKNFMDPCRKSSLLFHNCPFIPTNTSPKQGQRMNKMAPSISLNTEPWRY